jgi:hypothetical protein
MNKKWIAINLVLLSVAVLLAWQLHISIDRFNAENGLSNLRPTQDVKQKIALDKALPEVQARPVYNAAEFGVIADQNVFSESRTREEKTEVAPVAAAVPELAIKPVLVGVTLFGNQRLAAIIDPTVQGTARRAQTKRVGDVFQGYTITDITERQMVLEAGGRREIIPLHDGSKRQGQQGGKTPILATRVVSIGKGSAGTSSATGSPAATSVIAPAGRPSPASSIPAQSVTGSSGAPGTAGSAAGIRILPGRQATPVAPTPQAPATGTQAPGVSPPAGSRVIRTPFGDIVRPDVSPNP